jgi:hypothetical protein
MRTIAACCFADSGAAGALKAAGCGNPGGIGCARPVATMPSNRSKPKPWREQFLYAGFIRGPYRSVIMVDRSKADDALLLLGRIFIAWIFIPSGLRKLMDIERFAASLTKDRKIPSRPCREK